MHKRNFLLTALSLLFISTSTLAQTAAAEKVADKGFMVSNDKIYVVMAVVVTILAGLIFYVARLDKKISRLEKEN
jgi:peptidoglycan hydrolase CwlO-like protein